MRGAHQAGWRGERRTEDRVSTERRAPTTPRLSTGQALPELRIVPASAVFLHEDCDPGRVRRLSSRLQEDGLLRNPPIAAALPEGNYVVLDGANRTSALRALGASAILLQVVDYDDPAVGLEVWHHMLPGPADIPDRLRGQGLPLRVGTVTDAAQWLAERAVACYLVTPTRVVAVPTAPSMRSLASALAQVVDAYKGSTRIYRVLTTDFETLSGQYGPVGAIVVFPTFSKREIRELAHAPTKLPAGVTRHVISGRALRVNVPLEVLTAPGPVDGKNQWLRERIHQQLLDDRIRYYPEASFLFDE